MKMFRQMQQQMEKIQKELGETTLETTAGGGAVKVSITGDQRVTAIKVDPAALEPGDAEFLGDMLLAAVNDAIQQSQALAKKKLSVLTGGLNIPGLG
ncbi:MAG: YbaB/EbfC family nucleoid-associated protein [Actinobacteria bacterium]|nr:YbaB/EbfC family nucleoid-associated protein [Actinomycetota bacterium]